MPPKRLQQALATRGMGFNCHFAQQQFSSPKCRGGSISAAPSHGTARLLYPIKLPRRPFAVEAVWGHERRAIQSGRCKVDNRRRVSASGKKKRSAKIIRFVKPGTTSVFPALKARHPAFAVAGADARGISFKMRV
jgi:hypothetical protein